MNDDLQRHERPAASSRWQRFRSYLALAADAVQVGLFLAVLGGAVLSAAVVALLLGTTLWAALPGAALVFLIFGTGCYLAGAQVRKTQLAVADAAAAGTSDRIRELEADRAAAVDLYHRSNAHVVKLQRFIRLLRETWELTMNEEAEEEADPDQVFGRLRHHVLNLVVTGMNRVGGEEIAVSFVCPIKVGLEQKLAASPDHHFGHRTSNQTRPLDIPNSLAGLAYSLGETQYSSDVPNDPRVQHLPGDSMQSLLCAPAFGATSSDPVGVLCVSSSQVAAFGNPDVLSKEPDVVFAEICAHLIVLVDYLAEP